ncbi:hypothetical protein [Actinomycetospora chibensis]|uniref:Uncharacterized protein n=1 Tax=Actinomycetospora chibensis TaxID=663606 RepID=A0ABV9REC8_9PSEU|nr:hypothetical protein [Actinomycetospora chibensis]MDD7925041.1 hypothetical protein [Actinomycetospora chibensis]
MTSILSRTLAGVAVGAAAVSTCMVGAGTALAIPPESPNDPSSHNSYPTVPGVASLPVPAGIADGAIGASKIVSDVIYAGRT